MDKYCAHVIINLLFLVLMGKYRKRVIYKDAIVNDIWIQIRKSF